MTLLRNISLVSLVSMSLGLFGFACKTSADQSQRQQLVAAATQGCQKSMNLLKTRQLPNLQRTETARAIFPHKWHEKMLQGSRGGDLPLQLNNGLDREIEALKMLATVYGKTEALIKGCEDLTADTDHATIAQLADSGAQIENELNNLRSRWNGHPSERADFKDLLSKDTNLLISYDPSGAAGYITLQVELDPQRIDNEIMLLSTLLASPRVAFNILK
jgi:hypothetical protein